MQARFHPCREHESILPGTLKFREMSPQEVFSLTLVCLFHFQFLILATWTREKKVEKVLRSGILTSYSSSSKNWRRESALCESPAAKRSSTVGCFPAGFAWNLGGALGLLGAESSSAQIDVLFAGGFLFEAGVAWELSSAHMSEPSRFPDLPFGWLCESSSAQIFELLLCGFFCALCESSSAQTFELFLCGFFCALCESSSAQTFELFLCGFFCWS